MSSASNLPNRILPPPPQSNRNISRQNSRPLDLIPGHAHATADITLPPPQATPPINRTLLATAGSYVSPPPQATPPSYIAPFSTPGNDYLTPPLSRNVASPPQATPDSTYLNLIGDDEEVAPPLPTRRRDMQNNVPITGSPSVTAPPEVYRGLAAEGGGLTPDGYLSPLPGYLPMTSPDVAEGGATSVAMETKMMEALGLGENSIFGWEAPPPDDGGEAPPDYTPRSVLNRGTNQSLKLTQVEQLQKEIGHKGGVKIVLRKIDCFHTLGLVDCFGKVWIAGWMQRARPFLHTAFHVGDQLISINGQVIENSKIAHKLIKHCENTDKITFIVRRLPYGKVIAMKREVEGQSLGITRDSGTAEIISVEQYGLAATSGLPIRAQTIDGRNLCNWWITEVNSRSINLFFKENEIEHRLNAVGKDITILVQPTEFIKGLKKSLKTTFKNYKDFLVQ